VVFGEEFAGRAETTDDLHVGCRGLTAGAEQFGRLVVLERVFLVVLAVQAVLPAELPVLFRVFDNGFIRDKHRKNVGYHA